MKGSSPLLEIREKCDTAPYRDESTMVMATTKIMTLMVLMLALQELAVISS